MKKLFWGFILLSIVSGTFVSCDNKKNNNKHEVNVVVSKPTDGWETLGRINVTTEKNLNATLFLYAKEVGGKVFYGVSPNKKRTPIMVKENWQYGRNGCYSKNSYKYHVYDSDSNENYYFNID